VLFHVAAYFREYYADAGSAWPKLKQINIDGTIRLLTEAEQRSIKKVIYVSSSGVIGNRADGLPGDESTPHDAQVMENLYFKSKVLAEEAIAEWLKTHTLPVVLILPTAMLGPRDAAPTAIGGVIVSLLQNKLPMMPPGGFEFVDARDVARAMLNAVECGKSGERYILTNHFYTMDDLARVLEKVAGSRAPRIKVTLPVMLMVARFAEAGARLRGKTPQITVAGVRTLVSTRPVTSAKATRELGATFRPFEDTVRDEAVWYRQNGYLR
jgi:dihydroflavonol-4-reductase